MKFALTIGLLVIAASAQHVLGDDGIVYLSISSKNLIYSLLLFKIRVLLLNVFC